jgi:hypothetical protein
LSFAGRGMNLTVKRLCVSAEGLLPSSLRAADIDSGAWYALDEPDASIHPRLQEILGLEAETRPDVEVFYGDEVIFDPAEPRKAHALLKSSFDLTHLIAQDYIGWMLLVRGSRLVACCGRAVDGALSTYGLLLNCMQEDSRVERIPHALSVRPLARRPLPFETRRRLLREWAREASPDCEFFEGLAPGSLRMQRTLDDRPPVTLVISSAQAIRADVGRFQDRPTVFHLLESLADADWPRDRLSVIVGDDIADDALRARWPFELRRGVSEQSGGAALNFAAKMNRLWRFAQSEYVVMMDDDVAPRGSGWLQALMTFAMDPGVGGVGARLLGPDGRIQHAGVAGGVMGPYVRIFAGQPGSEPTYCGWGEVHREWSMVTGGVFATRKTLLERMNGYDERFQHAFSDVDLCLRMRQLGLRIVYTPFAEFARLGDASWRSGRASPLELANFLERWRGFLTEDPAYHPALPKDASWVRPTELSDAWWLL